MKPGFLGYLIFFKNIKNKRNKVQRKLEKAQSLDQLLHLHQKKED